MMIKYFYSFTQGDLMKIGISGRILERLKQHKSSNPHPIRNAFIAYGEEKTVQSLEALIKLTLLPESGHEWMRSKDLRAVADLISEKNLPIIQFPSRDLESFHEGVREWTQNNFDYDVTPSMDLISQSREMIDVVFDHLPLSSSERRKQSACLSRFRGEGWKPLRGTRINSAL